MKTSLIAFLFLFFFASSAHSQLKESQWIDRENENTLLTISKQDDTYWIDFFEMPYKIVKGDPIPYVVYKGVQFPLLFEDDENLWFFGNGYMPLDKSVKGRFIGQWKSQDEDTRFVVKMDSNIELNWDIIKGSGKAVRFYPKRTEKGVHFTIGRDTLSFEIKDGFIIDNKGSRYSREKG